MKTSIHPRPNPIIAAMYTLRDMDIDVVVIHGPAGCGFMASRMLEESGVRVITTGFTENDLVFGGADSLIETLKVAKEKFNPSTIAVVGTCASMIIGEDMEAIIRRADLKDCKVFAVDSHGCMGANTAGAIKAIVAAKDVGIITPEESERQIRNMKAATQMERSVGLASKDYITPSKGVTKLTVCNKIMDALKGRRRIAVAMLAKKELAYRFADMYLVIDQAAKLYGCETYFVGNLDKGLGLPRIRGYCRDILTELDSNGVKVDAIGGLDEYALIGDTMREKIDEFNPDISIIVGMPHFLPGLKPEDILVTDQPRELANLISKGYGNSVGEISSHSMVMGTRSIIPLETAEILRELMNS